MALHWRLQTPEPEYEIFDILYKARHTRITSYSNFYCASLEICDRKILRHSDEIISPRASALSRPACEGDSGEPWGVRKWATSSSWVSSISDDFRLRLVHWPGPWCFLRMELRDSSVILWIWVLCVGNRWPETGKWTRTRASCHFTQQEATLTKTEFRSNYCICY